MKCLNGLVLASGFASVLAMAAAPQEVSLLLDEAYGRPVSLISRANYTLSSFDAVKPTGIGLRYGIEPWSFKAWSQSVSAGADFTCHPTYQDHLNVAGQNAGNYKYQYWAVGLHASTTCWLDFAAGVDLRSEQVKLEAISGAGGSTTLVRPWARGSVGKSFATRAGRVFVRAEAAVPLSIKNNGDLDQGDDARKSLAPSYQVGLNLGMRF